MAFLLLFKREKFKGIKIQRVRVMKKGKVYLIGCVTGHPEILIINLRHKLPNLKTEDLKTFKGEVVLWKS